jgi:hypothetical protein
MFSVNQHWDPLQVCIVGTTYGPEHYSWIKNAHVRNIFEKIAQETVNDLNSIVKVLTDHNVEVLRPEVGTNIHLRTPPPMVPRDFMTMIGSVFYENISELPWPGDIAWSDAYNDIKDSSWPEYSSYYDFCKLAPSNIKHEVANVYAIKSPQHSYSKIFEYISSQGNTIKSNVYDHMVLNGATVTRIGKDLYWSTQRVDFAHEEVPKILEFAEKEFPDYRHTVVNTGGHSDGVYCPVVPGLIISTEYVTEYQDTYPDWEVVFLPEQGKDAIKPWIDLKRKNQGRWWLPGYEYDDALISFVDTYMDDWVGFVDETVFDVNMLVIDPKNVIIFGEHQETINALERHGVTPHIAKLRHRYFWDGGIHCVTSDLNRIGECVDYFPNRRLNPGLRRIG